MQSLSERLANCASGGSIVPNRGLIRDAQAEITCLQAEVERLTTQRDRWQNDCIDAIESERELLVARDTAWNDAIEAAAHLIECDGDAMNGKADAARLIRALKRPISEVSG